METSGFLVSICRSPQLCVRARRLGESVLTREDDKIQTPTPPDGRKVLDQKNDPLDGHVGVSVFSLWRKRPTGLTLSPGKGGVMGDATTLIPICNCPPREYISIAVKVVLLKCVLCSFPQRIGRVCYIYAHTNALAQLPPSRCFSSFPTPFPPPSPIHEV